MIELFWIKSLLNFVVLCLCGLVVGILIHPSRKSWGRAWLIPILVLLGIHFLGFLRFTIWINLGHPLIAHIYGYGFVLNFLLGPAMLLGEQKGRYLGGTFLHFLPALMGLLLSISNLIEGSILLMVSQLHFIGYALFMLSGSKRNGLERGKDTKRTILGLWLGSYVAHFMEFALWSQFGLISETSAWVLFILSEVILALSLFYLIYVISVKKSKFSAREQSKLPDGILQLLEKEFTSYITQPKVYRDALVSQQKVAKALQVSPHHISKYLSHHYGETFLNIINSQRIDASQKILEDPNQRALTIQQVCYAVGFNSKSTFNTAFKKITGKTPSQYRAKHLAKDCQ